MSKTNDGLLFSDIDKNWKLALDPDNVFWGVIPKDNGSFVLQDSLIDIYKKERKHLDTELYNFRFNEPLNCVYIDPTDRCNVNCSYCYIPAQMRRNGSQMNKEQLEFVLKRIAEYFKDSVKKSVIVFHAAEPLLVKDILFDAINKFRNKFLFGIQTNALLLEKKDVEFIRKHRLGVGISLDAPTAAVNNRLRPAREGSGNFEKAPERIRRIFNRCC